MSSSSKITNYKKSAQNKNIKIVYLKNYPHYISLLAKWMFETWGHYNPGSSYERAKHMLKDHLNDTKAPIAFVALKNSQAVGMGCLRISHDPNKPTAWLESLYVHPDYRGKSISKAIINAIIDKASNLGHKKLYLLASPETSNWYKDNGWFIMGSDELFGNKVMVMEYDLYLAKVKVD